MKTVCIIGTGSNAMVLKHYLCEFTDKFIMMASPTDELPNADYYINSVTAFKYFRQTVDMINELDLKLFTFIHPTAHVDPTVVIHPGCFIGPMACIDYKTQISLNTWISRGTTVGHNVIINNGCFIGPDTTVCGGVTIEDNCFIGAKSLVYDKTVIEKNSVLNGGTIWKTEIKI